MSNTWILSLARSQWCYSPVHFELQSDLLSLWSNPTTASHHRLLSTGHAVKHFSTTTIGNEHCGWDSKVLSAGDDSTRRQPICERRHDFHQDHGCSWWSAKNDVSICTECEPGTASANSRNDDSTENRKKKTTYTARQSPHRDFDSVTRWQPIPWRIDCPIGDSDPYLVILQWKR